MALLRSKEKPKKAFTLVEVLLALLITAVIGGSAVSLLYTYLKNYEQSSEYTKALQRGQMALSILRPVILNAALGVPSDLGDFSALCSSMGLSMSSPLEIKNYSGMASGDIRLLYSLPSCFGAGEVVDDISSSFSLSLFPGDRPLVDLEQVLKSAYTKPGDTEAQRWVVFPSAGIPLRTSEIPKKLSIAVDGSPGKTRGSISLGDRLFILRYFRAYIGKQPGQSIPSLFIVDNANVPMPQVLGIRRIFFDWDGEGKLLRAWVLSQGDSLYSEPLDQTVEWPSSSGYTLTSDDKRYYLAVSVADWRVRN